MFFLFLEASLPPHPLLSYFLFIFMCSDEQTTKALTLPIPKYIYCPPFTCSSLLGLCYSTKSQWKLNNVCSKNLFSVCLYH